MSAFCETKLAHSFVFQLLLLNCFSFCCLGDDFHWYRLDDNGLWSQKPGPGNATNLDGKGNLIHDPRKAVNLPNGPDYSFVSFMEIFTNIIDGPAGPH